MSAPAGAPPGLARQLTAAADDIEMQNAPMDNVDSRTRSSHTPSHLVDGLWEIRLGGLTDPGVPGKVNQDDYFVWDAGDGRSFILGVFDGHGKELGSLAAQVAKQAVIDALCNEQSIAAIRHNPEAVFAEAFQQAHKSIEKNFREFYEKNGWIVSVSNQGFLTRQRSKDSAVLCVHGGTTATVIVVLDGRWMISANVGDSSAVLCGCGSRVHASTLDEWLTLPASSEPHLGRNGFLLVNTTSRKSVSVETSQYELTNKNPDTCLELSADHSPENESEFLRIQRTRPHPSKDGHPELSFVYDTFSASKLRCPAIYEYYEGTSGSNSIRKTGQGAYYKNVRNEWASLVATPPNAPFQDALAFTRSLGDLHLQAYGVSHHPEIHWCDLTQMKGTDGKPIPPGGPLVLALCSDGVWDNWRFEDVAQFVLHPGRVDFALRHETAQACCVDFMQANLERARVNFGASADNMTTVLAYLIPHGQRLQSIHQSVLNSTGSGVASATGTGTGTGTGAIGTGTNSGTGTSDFSKMNGK